MGDTIKRQTYSVVIADNTGAVLADDQRYAMNAAIRASEALVPGIARSEGAIYHGVNPQRVGHVYTPTEQAMTCPVCGLSPS